MLERMYDCVDFWGPFLEYTRVRVLLYSEADASLLALPLPFSRDAAPIYYLIVRPKICTVDDACLNKHVIRRRRLPPVICAPASYGSAEVDSGPVL